MASPDVVAALAAGFSLEANFTDDDSFVERLAHVIDGESGDGGGSQCFHLDAGACGGSCGGANLDAFVHDSGLNIDKSQWERVAHGNEVSGALGGLDSGDACHFERIAFGV